MFCDYLTGQEAGSYVARKYAEGHGVSDIGRRLASDAFDRVLVRWSRRSTWVTRWADIYTRWFYRRSVLRRKLLLLMAILECAPEHYAFFEAGDGHNRARFWLWLTAKGLGFLVHFSAAVLFFSMVRLVVRLLPEPAHVPPGEERWAES